MTESDPQSPTTTPVRDWLDEHPVTAAYTAVMVTILFVLQVIDLVNV